MSWLTFLMYLVAFGLGFALGSLATWQRKLIRGTELAVPKIPLTAKRVDVLMALGIIVAIIITVVQGMVASRIMLECNTQVWDAMDHRVASTDMAMAAHRDLVTELATGVRNDDLTEQELNQIILDYEGRMDEVDQYMADHPLPLPKNTVERCRVT